jgi:hypothetical protein
MNHQQRTKGKAMIVRKFEVKEHQEFGTLGFAPGWIPDSDPYSGMAVPHDILEHMPSEKYGPVEGEFMATGAMYWIRGETGWFCGRSIYGIENMSADIPDIMTRVAYEEQSFKAPPKTRRLDESIEDDFKAIIQKGMKMLIEDDCLDGDQLSDLEARHVREGMLGWMRKGYRAALKRYRDVDNYSMSYLFTRIMERSGALLKCAEEGQVLTVRIDLQSMNAHLDLDYPKDYYN